MHLFKRRRIYLLVGMILSWCIFKLPEGKKTTSEPVGEILVPRGQSYFYVTPEAKRHSSFEVWRPSNFFDLSSGSLSPQRCEGTQVIMHTQATRLWHYLPTQLLVGLSQFDHYLIFSDSPDFIGRDEIHDALAEVDPQYVQNAKHFEPYRIQRSIRDQHIHVMPDEVAISGVADSLKFIMLPSLLKTWRQEPNHNWYLIVGDDTYVFSHNLCEFLSGLDPEEPIYLGSAVAGLDHLFADLRSGIILSHAAMRAAFDDPRSEAWVNEYTKRVVHECCGDYILAVFLHEKIGISLNIEVSSGHFQGNPPYKVPSSARNWCKSILTTGRQHARDLQLLSEYTRLKKGQVLFSDIYFDFIKPYLPSNPQINWDNTARDVEYDPTMETSTQDQAPYKTIEACRKACEGLGNCLMLCYDSYMQYCGLGLSSVSLGKPVLHYEGGMDQNLCSAYGLRCQERQPGDHMTSEWFIERIRQMRNTLDCDFLFDDPTSEGVPWGSLDQAEGWWIRARERYKNL